MKKTAWQRFWRKFWRKNKWRKILFIFLAQQAIKIYFSKKLGQQFIEITSSIEHKHGIENYGFKIKTPNHLIGLVTDTAYFPELLGSYQNCEILIMNVPYSIQDKPKPKHLDIPAVEEFIKAIKPKKVVLTHFGSNILKANPVLLAEKLSQKYGTEVISAEDDMILEL